MTNIKQDITGERFSRLTVVSKESPGKHGHTMLKCQCECGKQVVIRYSHLGSGDVKSCGCYRDDLGRTALTTHGLRKHPLYNVWGRIIQRCYNKEAPDYKRYGARGIVVSDEFMDAEAFINYVDSELGNKPSTKHSLDRIDNNKGYERGNLRWATRAEQARNRRSTTMILLCGQEIPLPDACDIFGVKRKIAYQQIARGWPLVDVLLGKPKRAAA